MSGFDEAHGLGGTFPVTICLRHHRCRVWPISLQRMVGGIIWFLRFALLQLFQFLLQIFAALDLSRPFEADHVRLATRGGYASHLVDEIHCRLDFFFPCLPLTSKESGRRLRVVVALVPDEGRVLQVLKTLDESLDLLFLCQGPFSGSKFG